MRADPQSSKSKSKIEDELISMAGLNPAQYDKTEEELAQEEQMRQAEMMKTNHTIYDLLLGKRPPFAWDDPQFRGK